MITANTMYASQGNTCSCKCGNDIALGDQIVLVQDNKGLTHIIKPECSFGFLKRMEGTK